MKKTLLLFTLLFGFITLAQIPANYYNSATGLTGYNLKTQLRNIISSGHVNQGYGALYNGYVSTDTDNYYENDGTVLDMYSENPNNNDPYNYTHGNNQCGNQNSEGDCYNREHLMPQSWYNSSQPMQSDIHHVVPTDGRVNNFRGHLTFGEVTNPNWTSLNGTKRGTNTILGFNGTVFEPIDEFKGDIARIYFYMATRYQNNIASWENANDGSLPTFDGSSDQVFEDWILNMLIAWHTNDPVSQREIDRNNAAYNYQGNANPYISNPEWVNIVWNPEPDTINPTIPLNLTATNITFSTVDLNWVASTDNIGVTGYDIYRDNVLINSSVTNSFSDFGLTPNTQYTYYVVAKDDALNLSDNSNLITITTLEMPSFIFAEDFNDCNTVSANFITYNEVSDKDWTCIIAFGQNDTGAMQMNGFQEDELSKDWLISTNPIEFSQYLNEKLSVFFAHRFGTTALELVYSTNYDGLGNPADFNWSTIPNVTIDIPNGSSTEITQNIVNADISTLSEDAYVAFKYYSDGFPTRWTVDSFNITGDDVLAIEDFTAKNNIVIYPNPTITNSFTIKSNRTIKNTKLFNTFGTLVDIYNVQPNKIKFNNLNKGVYFLTINFEKETIFKKIIIN